jgi:hypothetical protein
VDRATLSSDEDAALELFFDVFKTLNLSAPTVSIIPVSAIPENPESSSVNALRRVVYTGLIRDSSMPSSFTFNVYIHKLVLSSIGDVVTTLALTAAHIKAAMYFASATPDDISCGNHIGFDVNDEGSAKRALAFAKSVASCMTAVGQVAFSRRATEVTRARSSTPSRVLQIFRKVTGSVVDKINVISRFSKASARKETSSSSSSSSSLLSPTSSASGSVAMSRLLERKNTLTKSLMSNSLQRKPSIPQIEQKISTLQRQQSSISLGISNTATARSFLIPSDTIRPTNEFATGSLPERLSAFRGVDAARRSRLELYFQKIERDVLEETKPTDLEEVEEVDTVLTKDEFNDVAKSAPDYKTNLTKSLLTIENSLDRANRVFVVANQALQESSLIVADMEKKEEEAINRLRRIKKAHRINKILMGVDDDEEGESFDEDSIDLDVEEYDRTLGDDSSQPSPTPEEKKSAIQAHYLSFSVSDAELEKEAACVQVLESRMNVRTCEESVTAIASRIDRLEKQREQLEMELG